MHRPLKVSITGKVLIVVLVTYICSSPLLFEFVTLILTLC